MKIFRRDYLTGKSHDERRDSYYYDDQRFMDIHYNRSYSMTKRAAVAEVLKEYGYLRVYDGE